MTTIRDRGALGRAGGAGATTGPPVPWRPSHDVRRDPPGSSRASCRRRPGSGPTASVPI